MENKKKYQVGDLVICRFQPGAQNYDSRHGFIPMHHTIKDEIGIVVGHRESGLKGGSADYRVNFPQFSGYVHILAASALEPME
tara:strand:- start:1753 stop:2001 length:249 start_codon:yes stop_codon:yes gene_type:complete